MTEVPAGPFSPYASRMSEIAAYCQHYIARYNGLVASLPPEADAFLGQRRDISTANVCLGSDGLLISYLELDMAALYSMAPGVFIIDTPDPLALIVQRSTGNFMKIAEPPEDLGVAWLDTTFPPTRLPDDLPMSETKANLSPEMREALKAGITNEVTCMAITPTTQYKNGKVDGQVGTRNHVFSPLHHLSDGRTIRQYTWSFMDIMWYLDANLLTQDLASSMAEQDCKIAMLAMEAGLSGARTYANPYETVGATLCMSCDEFEALLNQVDVDENKVQQFLEQPEHSFIIAPVHDRICPRKGIGGKYVTDFAVHKPTGDWHFIEIEHPSKLIFQPSSQEQAAHLTHAIGQVNDWLRFVDENTDTSQREYGLEGVYRPTGAVIAGRDQDLGETARGRLRHRNAENLRVEVKTYDVLLADARAYVRSLLTANRLQ